MRKWLAAVQVLALGLTACGGGQIEEAASDRDRARASQDWKLVLDDDGMRHEMPMERMDIFLTEDESYCEIFEIRGAGVTLVGEFPADIHVDYEAAYERLIGREIIILRRGGDPREPKMSKVTLDGVVTPVTSGTFTVERLSGKWEDVDGDRTLHGTIELRVPGSDGERTLRGRFATHAVTWV
jgi:hypothetical protein